MSSKEKVREALLPKRKKGRTVFPTVQAARELLLERATEILESYLAVCAEARAAGNHEVATKSLQWLMEHAPTDAEGARMIDISIDKPKQIEQGHGPHIQIGFQLGGVTTNGLALPEAITVDPVKQDG